MNTQQVNELVLQSLEQEIGGIQVYETALKCAINEDLRDEWKKIPGADSEARANSARGLQSA